MDMTRMLTIGEAAARAGVSIRALRHYDEIGLLSPVRVPGSGYRLYDEAAMRRLEQILFFRELDFPLEEIGRMLSHADYDESAAMKRQLDLLKKRRERLDGLIDRLSRAIDGEEQPRFEVFDMKEIEKMKREYADEARARWGGTDAWKESERRTAAYSDAEVTAAQQEMDALMHAFADVRALPPQDARVQELAARWQAHITKWYYPCTDEILAGLGQMYACDERFMKNIDRCGEGTAACMARAIEAYVVGRRA